MAIYERWNGRVDNLVKLRRNFFNDGVMFDPYTVDKIEIWATRYDPEYEAENPGVLLKDTLYGSRMVLAGLTNNAYSILGFETGQISPDIVAMTEFEYDFTASASVTVPHNLGDRTPIVTVYDNAGVVLIPDTITSIDVNTIVVTFAIPQSGTIDIVGSTPIAPSIPQSLIKKYTQSFANVTQVIVTHNLNDDFPTVVIYDSNYNQIFPDVVQAIDSNTIVVDFGTYQTGTVVVTGGNVGYAIRGFGCQAVLLGTRAENYDIHTGENDTLLVSIDGGSDQTITLTQNYHAQANDIISQINTTLVGAKAYIYNGNMIQLISDSYGSTASIELKTVANSAYTSIGLAQGLYEGLGYPPAETAGTRNGTITITDTTNWIKLAIDGGADIDVDLMEGDTGTKLLTGSQIAAIIRGFLILPVDAEVSTLRKISIIGATTSIEVKAIANDAYTALGFTIGTYGISYTGTAQETYLIDATNYKMRIINNYQPSCDVDLTYGNRTVFQIVADINSAFTANGIDAVAEVSTDSTAGRVILRSLKNDGITRTGVGQYYVEYLVPTTFVSNGVMTKQYLDVWYYAPIMAYETDVADDTDSFIVYADKYFLDSGFSNFDFAFTLLRDLFIKGEKRPMITKVVALPKYKTPTINDWILPLADSQYRIFTDENSLVQDWADTEVNTGTEIRVELDTTNALYREGLYNLQLRLNLPNSDIIMSNKMKFRITNK